MERYCTKCGKITIKKNDNLFVCETGHENWINPATGVSAYVIKDGKVLFGVRSSDPGKGKLDVPGGFVEVHESAEQAAIREAKEEFNIDITIKSCFGTYASVYDGRPALNIVLIATMADQDILPSDDMSGGEPTWRDIENLPGSGEVMDNWMVMAHKDLLAWWQGAQTMTKVKICGIKRKEDALAAVRYGADAIGLLVGQKHASSDFISEEMAREIAQSLPPFCSSVMVTHLNSVFEIVGLAQRIGVTTIQLHGDSTPEDAREIKRQLPYIKLYKAIHINDESAIDFGKQFLGDVDAILLDTANKATDQVGGTGLVHDWNISKRMVELYSKPVILAGGLNPNNVREAIKTVRPFGVDVNSGTKGADGFKDHSKLQQFIEAAKVTS